MQGTYLMLVYSVVNVFEIFASHYSMAEKKKKCADIFLKIAKKLQKSPLRPMDFEKER